MILVFHWSLWYLTLYPHIFIIIYKNSTRFWVVCDDNFDWWFFWISVFPSAIVFREELYMQIYDILVNIITWFFHMYIQILLTRKIYPARFIIQLASCHPTHFMIYAARLDTRPELKCNSLCTSDRVAINNHSKGFPIIWNNLQLIEMNSSHSKVAITFGTPTAS